MNIVKSFLVVASLLILAACGGTDTKIVEVVGPVVEVEKPIEQSAIFSYNNEKSILPYSETSEVIGNIVFSKYENAKIEKISMKIAYEFDGDDSISFPPESRISIGSSNLEAQGSRYEVQGDFNVVNNVFTLSANIDIWSFRQMGGSITFSDIVVEATDNQGNPITVSGLEGSFTLNIEKGDELDEFSVQLENKYSVNELKTPVAQLRLENNHRLCDGVIKISAKKIYPNGDILAELIDLLDNITPETRIESIELIDSEGITYSARYNEYGAYFYNLDFKEDDFTEFSVVINSSNDEVIFQNLQFTFEAFDFNDCQTGIETIYNPIEIELAETVDLLPAFMNLISIVEFSGGVEEDNSILAFQGTYYLETSEFYINSVYFQELSLNYSGTNINLITDDFEVFINSVYVNQGDYTINIVDGKIYFNFSFNEILVNNSQAYSIEIYYDGRKKITSSDADISFETESYLYRLPDDRTIRITE